MKIKYIEKIRSIDPAAAEYIETVVIPRYDKKALHQLTKTRGFLFWKKPPKWTALDLFIWETSPQGREYWLNIKERLKDANN